jgi:hypothetical protein
VPCYFDYNDYEKYLDDKNENDATLGTEPDSRQTKVSAK